MRATNAAIKVGRLSRPSPCPVAGRATPTGSCWRQRKLSINIPPGLLNEGRKALRLRCRHQTPTELAWLAPSIIETADIMPCAIITIAAYGKFSCLVLVQVSYTNFEIKGQDGTIPRLKRQSTIEP